MSGKSLLFALTVFCAILTAAQPSSTPSESSPAKVKTEPVTVPMDLAGNRPHVMLTLEGPGGQRHDVRFIVDTGGGTFLVSQAVADKVGFKASGPVQKQEGAEFAPFAPGRAQLGGMSLDLKGVRAAILVGNRPIYPGDPSEGVLPGQVLSRFDVVFDYPAERLTLAAHGTLKHCGTKVPCEIEPSTGFPRIACTVAGKPYYFLLDTGGTYCMISGAVLAGWLKADPAIPHETGAAGPANMIGAPMEVEALMLRIPGLEWAGYHVAGIGAVSRPVGVYEKWMSQMMAGPIVGSIGGNVLQDFRIEIDYAHQAAYVEKVRSLGGNDMDRVGVILRVTAEGAYEVLGTCLGAGKGLQDAVRQGDRLVAVGDTHVQGISRPAIDALLAAGPGLSRRYASSVTTDPLKSGPRSDGDQAGG